MRSGKASSSRFSLKDSLVGRFAALGSAARLVRGRRGCAWRSRAVASRGSLLGTPCLNALPVAVAAGVFAPTPVALGGDHLVTTLSRKARSWLTRKSVPS